jgi:hypothetical protein
MEPKHSPHRGLGGIHGPYWPDPEGGPFAVLTHWAEVDGHLECVGVSLTSVRLNCETTPEDFVVPVASQPAAVGATLPRKVRWGAAMDAFREAFFRTVVPLGLEEGEYFSIASRIEEDGLDPWTAPRGEWLARMSDDQRDRGVGFQPTEVETATPTRRSPGRPSQFSNEEWEERADVYREAVRRGEPPNKALARRYHIPVDKARNWTKAMRGRGIDLPAPRQGRIPS